MKQFLLPLLSMLVLIGCTSVTSVTKDGLTFTHYNNPQAFGVSAGATVILKDEEVVSTWMSHKSGYMESLTGQAMQSGAIVGAAHLLGQGIAKSGDRVTTQSTQGQVNTQRQTQRGTNTQGMPMGNMD